MLQMFPAIASSHMAKKAQLLGIWLRALLDTEKRETSACLTVVWRLGSCIAIVEASEQGCAIYTVG